jgi:hypothetical protein
MKVTDPVSPTWSLKTQDNIYVLDFGRYGRGVVSGGAKISL